ncbi:helix-turn-helix domain-containing protein [Aquirufa antheringensis]|uniref:helix-turn-helix domain-containing protein n=1 Tax=Aquirufa antheringensis TaxID=2516559 RepID=UPI001F8C68B8|nr:helix-turn-helix domain-containing protein [Aquirufa antheringensis]MCE4215886.1 helix-turn-helix domain-containing protein [Pseudarcicella sp. GAP-15]MCZ2490199.1 helix-turn-helix transcriptional regulator [Aquirufa antheringensis]
MNNNLTTFQSHLDEYYGKRGTLTREEYEEGFEAFKLGAILRELRLEQGLTQKQLAQKCGTSKTSISRIENNAGDIRLSTLMRIIRVGLGRQLTFSLDIPSNVVKSLSGVVNLPEDFDLKEEYKKYIVSKYSK